MYPSQTQPNFNQALKSGPKGRTCPSQIGFHAAQDKWTWAWAGPSCTPKLISNSIHLSSTILLVSLKPMEKGRLNNAYRLSIVPVHSSGWNILVAILVSILKNGLIHTPCLEKYVPSGKMKNEVCLKKCIETWQVGRTFQQNSIESIPKLLLLLVDSIEEMELIPKSYHTEIERGPSLSWNLGTTSWINSVFFH